MAFPVAAQAPKPAQNAAPDDAGRSAIAYMSEQPVRAPHAMVVTVHHLATDAGVSILKAGGNAVDAAVAVGFALAVVHPVAGNIGGGGFMLVHEHDGRNVFIDYREKAPLAATTNMYLDAQGSIIPHASIVGYRAIGVPGAVAGLVYAEKKYGKLTLAKVMAPAIRLAADGFVLSDEEAAEMHDKILTGFPASRTIFQRDGDFYKAGEVFRQPELAATLRTIAKDPDDFYRGAMAKQIAEAVQKGGGLITAADMARYTVKERAAGDGDVSRVRNCERAAALIGRRSPDRDAEYSRWLQSACARGSHSTGDAPGGGGVSASVYGSVELSWRSGLREDSGREADRARRMARRGASRLRRITQVPRHRSSGRLDFCRRRRRWPMSRQEAVDTTHYSVMDAEGDAVSVTTTLNGGYGSGRNRARTGVPAERRDG